MDESTYDLLLAEGFTAEEIEELMELGVLATEQDMATRSLERAEFLRQTPLPRGRAHRRIYRAAHPLEHVAAGLDRFRGEMGIAAYPQEAQRIANEQARRRMGWLRGGTGPIEENSEVSTYAVSPGRFRPMYRRPI